MDRKNPFFTGLQRFGVDKGLLYLQDPFHTLLNLPWWKFIIIFFSTYVAQFCTFALLYWAFPTTCTHGIDGNFAHALWMSSRTASTIGFNQVGSSRGWCGSSVATIFVIYSCRHSNISHVSATCVFASDAAVAAVCLHWPPCTGRTSPWAASGVASLHAQQQLSSSSSYGSTQVQQLTVCRCCCCSIAADLS
jgi:hypothetical protein